MSDNDEFLLDIKNLQSLAETFGMETGFYKEAHKRLTGKWLMKEAPQNLVLMRQKILKQFEHNS